MDYGFKINGILRMNFMKKVGDVINLAEMKVTKYNM